uniref:Uncharacterized protein n=1 Tax=Arundo donax TaxID=35708 RepID=A0A0A8ZGZ2_ARUDO
MFYICLER